jgi:hypothetical protein
MIVCFISGTQPAGGALGGNLLNIELKNVANTNAQVLQTSFLIIYSESPFPIDVH